MDETSKREGGARRELVLVEWGGRRFAVPAEEVDCTAEGRAPSPLPHAPAAVLGVVSARGRMRTLLDPSALLAPTDERADAPAEGGEKTLTSGGEKEATGGGEKEVSGDDGGAVRFCVALRGDEQLALAAERVERVEVAEGEIRFYAEPRGAARGTLMADALEVVLLDPSRLFEAAVRGAERRRKR